MGRIFVVELKGRTYRCKLCKTHLALAEHLVSRAFHCRRGKAYLFNNAVNISFGAVEERMMLSGVHIVVDIFCCSCGQIVGWKYEGAREKSQKYMEGFHILRKSTSLISLKHEYSHSFIRGRIVDELDFPSDIYTDICPSMSDAEES